MIDGFSLSFFLLTFWVLPGLIGLPFMVLSISRFAPKLVAPSKRSSMKRKAATL